MANLLGDDPLPIGGEFALFDGDVRIVRNEQRKYVPKGRGAYWVASGRDALLALVGRYGLSQSDELLLPSYICHEVIETLAPRVRVSFYPVKADLSVDIRSFESRIAPATRAVLLVHYFGFPHPQLQTMARSCRDRGIALVEDCVQAAFTRVNGRGLGSVGDAAFTSLRKFLPIPDGSWLVTRSRFPMRLQESPAHRFYVERRGAVLRIKGLSHQYARCVPDSVFKEAFALAEQAFGYRKPAPMGKVSLHLLRRFPLDAWARQRRKNYRQLLLLLPSKVKPLFCQLHAGVVPLGLPILARHRDALQQELADERIYAPVHWRLRGVPKEYEVAWNLSEHELTLPIDQRYRSSEIKRIAKAVRRYA